MKFCKKKKAKYIVEMADVLLTFDKKKEIDVLVDEAILNKFEEDIKVFKRAQKDTYQLVYNLPAKRKIGF